MDFGRLQVCSSSQAWAIFTVTGLTGRYHCQKLVDTTY
uniref:Uncharacterized protein n=1 Tax=Arundo donax TaxID=35708 RepID=A0A0A9AHL2_ARUDO